MHLAVAPACNVQCNYCNHKYDCANESRPGVVSELLNVEQALQKARAVAAAIPQLSVLVSRPWRSIGKSNPHFRHTGRVALRIARCEIVRCRLMV